MLRSLKEVQADDSVVGFYQATTLGAFYNQTLVDTQAIHQVKLRHGGIVVVHGVSTRIKSASSVIYSHDTLKTSRRQRVETQPSVLSG
jgi:translation initiation factor 3 subunit H